MNSDHSDETVIANPDPLGTIQAFAIDPADNHTFYAATGKDQKFALFISRDSGNSWQQTDTLPEQARHIWVDPNSPRESRTLYAAGQHYVVVKNASGAQNRPTPSEMLDVSMGFGDQKKTVIYGVSKQGIFVSTDSASSWQKAEFPGNGSQFRAIATSLRHPETAYVSYKDMSEGMQLLNLEQMLVVPLQVRDVHRHDDPVPPQHDRRWRVFGVVIADTHGSTELGLRHDRAGAFRPARDPRDC